MILHTAETGNWVAVIIAVLIVGYIFYNFIRSKKQMNKPPSEKVKILSDANFNSTIKTGVSLVDFWAPWCGPCRVQGPIINDLGMKLAIKQIYVNLI